MTLSPSAASAGAGLVAYELESWHWRKGIGSSAVSAVLEEHRSNCGVRTFVAVLKAANHRSRGLLQKLGFRPASPEEVAMYRAGRDEAVLVRPASSDVRSHREESET